MEFWKVKKKKIKGKRRKQAVVRLNSGILRRSLVTMCGHRWFLFVTLIDEIGLVWNWILFEWLSKFLISYGMTLLNWLLEKFAFCLTFWVFADILKSAQEEMHFNRPFYNWVALQIIVTVIFSSAGIWVLLRLNLRIFYSQLSLQPLELTVGGLISWIWFKWFW